TALLERYTDVSGPLARRGAPVMGVGAEYQEVLNLSMSRGRFLTVLDGLAPYRVVVLGGQLSRALFGLRDPLQESVRIEGDWFRVVGVLADRAGSGGGIGSLAAPDLNRAALVPLPTLGGAASASDPARRVDAIWLRISDGERVLQVGK